MCKWNNKIYYSFYSICSLFFISICLCKNCKHDLAGLENAMGGYENGKDTRGRTMDERYLNTCSIKQIAIGLLGHMSDQSINY